MNAFAKKESDPLATEDIEEEVAHAAWKKETEETAKEDAAAEKEDAAWKKETAAVQKLYGEANDVLREHGNNLAYQRRISLVYVRCWIFRF